MTRSEVALRIARRQHLVADAIGNGLTTRSASRTDRPKLRDHPEMAPAAARPGVDRGSARPPPLAHRDSAETGHCGRTGRPRKRGGTAA